MRPIYIIVIIFINLSSNLSATQPSVVLRATVDKNKITIGDRIVYRVELKYNPKIKIAFPNIAGQLSAFEIKDYKIEGPNKIWWKMFLRQRYLISTFTTGEYTIPPVTVDYWDEKGEKKQISSDKIAVFVESVKPKPTDKEDIRDIKSPVYLYHSFWFYFFLIFIPFLAGAAFLGYRYYRQRKALDILKENTPSRPPEEIARERLAKLKELNLPAQARVKEYYIILSEIVRQYLAARFRIPVIDRTTNELYLEMRETNIDKKHCQSVKSFLEQCDLVKFAKYITDAETSEQDFFAAEKIVEITTPAPAPEPELAGK